MKAYFLGFGGSEDEAPGVPSGAWGQVDREQMGKLASPHVHLPLQN